MVLEALATYGPGNAPGGARCGRERPRWRIPIILQGKGGTDGHTIMAERVLAEMMICDDELVGEGIS